MTNYDVKRFALVLAVQAEIEAMKAENAICAFWGREPTYFYHHFEDKVNELQHLAKKPDEQL